LFYEFKSKPTNAQDYEQVSDVFTTPTYVSANKLPPQGVFVKEPQILIASKYTIVGFTIEVFTQLTMLKYIGA
jgi:hypothetical protein